MYHFHYHRNEHDSNERGEVCYYQANEQVSDRSSSASLYKLKFDTVPYNL